VEIVADNGSYHNWSVFDFRGIAEHVLEMTQWRSEFAPTPIAPQPVLQGPLADLLEWQSMAQGAYAANTLRAQKADGAIFQAYCESVGEAYLPAKPHTVRGFIAAQVKAGKKPATIQRYVPNPEDEAIHQRAERGEITTEEAIAIFRERALERERQALARKHPKPG
jgi:hypothetical protein